MPYTDDDLLPSERGFLVPGCFVPGYFTPAVNTMVIGRHLGLLNRLIGYRIAEQADLTNPGGQYRTFCVGHSLGSHVCGFMGKATNGYQQLPKLTRIIAMDPAGKSLELPIFLCRVFKTHF